MIQENARFALGQVTATPGALQALHDSNQSPHDLLSRHVRGDWGDLCREDQEANEHAVGEGMRILSAYRTRNGVRVWVITEADRASTTLLLPEEY